MRTKRKWSWAQSEEILQNESPYDSATFSMIYVMNKHEHLYIYDIYIYIKSYGYSYSNYICICNIYVSNIIHIVHILILLLNFYF